MYIINSIPNKCCCSFAHILTNVNFFPMPIPFLSFFIFITNKLPPFTFPSIFITNKSFVIEAFRSEVLPTTLLLYYSVASPFAHILLIASVSFPKSTASAHTYHTYTYIHIHHPFFFNKRRRLIKDITQKSTIKNTQQ